MAAIVVTWASPAGADEGEAALLYRRGREALDAGRYDEACADIARSQEIEPLLPKLAYLAVCHERQGKTASAYREYLEVADKARIAGASDREAKARGLADRLAPALLRVRFVRSSTRPDEQIACNGAPLPSALPDGDVALDPGSYTCIVSAQQHVSWSTSFALDVETTREVTLVVPPLEPVAEAPVVPREPRPTVAPTSKAPRSRALAPPSEATDPLPFYIGAGVGYAFGVAGAIVSAVYGARTYDMKAESDALCRQGCLRSGVAAMDDARTNAYVATAGFVVGLVGLGTGAFLTVWGATRPSDATTVSAGLGSLTIAGTF